MAPNWMLTDASAGLNLLLHPVQNLEMQFFEDEDQVENLQCLGFFCAGRWK